MELKIETNQAQHRNKAIIYQAIGWVTGNYQPSADNPDCGVLVTQDGLAVPAQLKGRLHHQHEKKFPNYTTKADLLPENVLWTVYPSTEPLRLQLVNINTLQSLGSDSTKLKRENQRIVDVFRLVGQIESVADGSITILIRRNEQPRKGKEDASEYQPFVLQVKGSLPAESVGQIWELNVQRQETTLVLSKGYFVRRSLGKPKLIDQKQEIDSRKTKAATDVLPPLKKAAKGQSSVQAPIQQEGATNPQPGDCAAKSAPPQTFAQETTSTASTIASNSLTKGKMEVVVKVTEFPDDIKTVDKGCKEFAVDTGAAIVTISVKPKAFRLLEQAQQTYPAWIAAISGQISEQTATGFRLESPAIQVFERRTKDSSPNKEDTSRNKSESPQASVSQPPLTVITTAPPHNLKHHKAAVTVLHEPSSTAEIIPASK